MPRKGPAATSPRELREQVRAFALAEWRKRTGTGWDAAVNPRIVAGVLRYDGETPWQQAYKEPSEIAQALLSALRDAIEFVSAMHPSIRDEHLRHAAHPSSEWYFAEQQEHRKAARTGEHAAALLIEAVEGLIPLTAAAGELAWTATIPTPADEVKDSADDRVIHLLRQLANPHLAYRGCAESSDSQLRILAQPHQDTEAQLNAAIALLRPFRALERAAAMRPPADAKAKRSDLAFALLAPEGHGGVWRALGLAAPIDQIDPGNRSAAPRLAALAYLLAFTIELTPTINVALKHGPVRVADVVSAECKAMKEAIVRARARLAASGP